MAKIEATYKFLGQDVLAEPEWRIVKRYGVSFTESDLPVTNVGKARRIDMEFSIKPAPDSNWLTQAENALGTTISMPVVQKKAEDMNAGNVVTSAAETKGSSLIGFASNVPEATLTPDRIIKFANHDGVYMVRISSTTNIRITPELNVDVPAGTVIYHADGDPGLTYSGIFEGDFQPRHSGDRIGRTIRIRLIERR